MGVGLSGGRHTRVVEPLGSAPLAPPTLLLLCGHLLHIHRDNGHGLILLAVRVPGRGRGVGGRAGRGSRCMGGAKQDGCSWISRH